MPPKPKFTKEEVAKEALGIIKERGLDNLTARNLGARLGASARPIFTVFNNMDEVKWAARELAMREFEAYAGDYREYTPAFKRIGMLMVSYAVNEPELYKLLFMQERKEGRSFEDAISDLGEMAPVCIELIKKDYKMSDSEAETLFEQMWVHTFGMGVLCAMKVCNFTEEEISEKLGQAFAGMVMAIKTDNLENITAKPEKNSDGKFCGVQVEKLPYMKS